VKELFSTTDSDWGAADHRFRHQLEYDDLIKDARTVIANLTPLRREVRSRKERWYDLRMRPYRTTDDKIDGVVITFVDVTERKFMEERLRSLVNKAGDPNKGPLV
jgi:two-component system, chemotaxis family, CheB/CheR fusion protein